MESFSQLRIPYPNDSSLCQVDLKLFRMVKEMYIVTVGC